MLVLSRKSGESIVIEGPGPVTIKVLKQRAGTVRIGVTAPPITKIRRSELKAA